MNNRGQMFRPAMPRRSRQAPSLIAIIFAFVLIMCLAVTMGYLVTKQIIYPYILKQELPITESRPSSGGVVVDENEVPPAAPSSEPTVIDGSAAAPPANTQSSESSQTDGAQDAQPANQTVSPTEGNVSGPASPASTSVQTQPAGFCLQYGNLSTKEAADTLVADLKAQGINCTVAEADGRFKVLGETYATKADARAHIPAVSLVVPDVFVTALP